MDLTVEDYDEFRLPRVGRRAPENRLERRAPKVRASLASRTGRGQPDRSVLRWGEGDPEYVFFHGRGQNAHTFDGVVLSLDRPSLTLSTSLVTVARTGETTATTGPST